MLSRLRCDGILMFKAVTGSSGHAPWWEGKCGTVQARDLASLLVLYDLAIVLFSRVSISANVSNLLSCLITVLLVNFHFSIIQVCFGSIVTSLPYQSPWHLEMRLRQKRLHLVSMV